MRIWETSFGRFCLAALCVVSASLGFWTSLQLMAHWDDLWSAGDFYQSGSISTPLVLAEDDVRRIALLSLRESWGDNLDYLERTLLERTEEGLQAEHTNYRYRLLEEESGALLRSNLPAGADLSDCSAQETSRFTITQGEDLTGSDRFFWSENDEYTVLQVWLGDAYLRSLCRRRWGDLDAVRLVLQLYGRELELLQRGGQPDSLHQSGSGVGGDQPAHRPG